MNETSQLQKMLRDRRLSLGLTMKEVATHCGVSEATVSRWESGNIGNMKRSRISALAEILQISPTDIVGGSDPPPQRQLVTDLIELVKGMSDDDIIDIIDYTKYILSKKKDLNKVPSR